MQGRGRRRCGKGDGRQASYMSLRRVDTVPATLLGVVTELLPHSGRIRQKRLNGPQWRRYV